MATTSNAATRPLRPAKLTNLFLRGALTARGYQGQTHDGGMPLSLCWKKSRRLHDRYEKSCLQSNFLIVFFVRHFFLIEKMWV
jgi:hypothetical protein